MNLQVVVGDVLEQPADALISTANPWLNMSGGVNGAIRLRCPQIQDQLKSILSQRDCKSLPAGQVVTTGAGDLPFEHIIHAIAIDPFYDSSRQIVSETLVNAFQQATHLGAQSVSMPTLATGYGPMTISDFGTAFASVHGSIQIQRVTIVVRSEHDAQTLQATLQ